MRQNLISVVILYGLLAVQTYGQERPAIKAPRAMIVLDLLGGQILGAEIGMDEAAARKALGVHQITDIKKVEYPDYFLLQSHDCLGLIFNFRGNRELADFYTNSRQVLLSNGLKLGQPIKNFSALLGEPQPPRKLPSGVGAELTYRIGEYELGVIVIDSNPGIAHALTLRKPAKAPKN